MFLFAFDFFDLDNFGFARTAIDIGFGFSVFRKRSSSLVALTIAAMFGNY